MTLTKGLENRSLFKRKVKEYYESRRMVTWYTERHAMSEAGVFTFKRRLEPVIATVKSRGTIALDAGCGPGLFTEEMAKMGADVVALDFSEAMAKTVHQNCQNVSSVNCVVGDIENLPLRQGCIDVAVCAGVIQHLPNPKRAARELAKAMRPDGGLVLTTMNLFSPLYFLFRMYVRLSRIVRKDFVHTSESPIEKAFHRRYIERTLANAGFSVTECSTLCLPSAEVPGPAMPFFVGVDRLTKRVSRLRALGADLVVRAYRSADPLIEKHL